MTSARWYAVTTQPRHEKVVAQQLESKSIEHFLPLLAAESRWKDRRVRIERPIFPGYVFTHIDLKDRRHVFSISSVVRMLSFGGAAAIIDDAEIEAVRLCLSYGNKPEPYPFPETGELVRVKSGPLQGLEGVVTRRKNHCRIVVSISLIHKSIAAEIDAHLLEPWDNSRMKLRRIDEHDVPSAIAACCPVNRYRHSRLSDFPGLQHIKQRDHSI